MAPETLRALSLVLLFPALSVAGAVQVPAATAAAEPGPESPAPLALPRLSGHINVDGVPDEEAWKGAASVERFFENGPGDNVAPPVTTVGLLGYDSEFLYIGVRCQDPEPAKIRAPYVDRDHVDDQDFVSVDIDARDEGRWSMIFRINPRGVQADGVFDEAAAGDDFSPDFHFESAARIGKEGWSAELRIPLSTLRYRAHVLGDPQTWRITFYRLYPRQYRTQIVSVPMPRGANCWLCYAQRFTGITDLPGGGGVLATPFVTAGASRTPADSAGSRVVHNDGNLEAGADVKWLPRPNLTADFTLRPDFSQVESDAPQIGINTRFALFYPEKRPFFLEGSDLWNSPIAVVNSRTITAPDWGARLTGRPGDASYTLLAAGDQGGGSVILPGASSSRLAPQAEDALVLFGRYRNSFGRSSAGAITTVREGAEGYFNGVGGVDFQWYPTDQDRTAGQILWSSTRDTKAGGLSGHAASFAWERSMRRLGWSVLLEDLAHGFRADSGFVPQTGVRHLSTTAGYALYPQGWLRKVRPQVSYDVVHESGAALVSETAALGLALDGRLQASLAWHPRDKNRALDGRLFEQNYWTAAARVLPNRRIPYLKLTLRRGDEIDIERSRLGTGTALTLLASLSPTDRLQAELAGERRWLDLPEGAGRARLFTASVARAKLTYTFTSRSFTRLVGEWEGLDEPQGGAAAERSLSGSALYGYRLNWQSILYLGYGNTPAPASATASGRQQELFLKIAYAFRH
jgi:hypothetical protein